MERAQYQMTILLFIIIIIMIAVPSTASHFLCLLPCVPWGLDV